MMKQEPMEVVSKVSTKEVREESFNLFGDVGSIIRFIIIVLDIILLSALLINLNRSCEGYLRVWIIGAIFLSSFLFSFVKRVQTLLKDDKGLYSEVFLLFLCFLWIYYGTIEINKSSACQKNAPFLFWTVFSFVTTAWCSIIGMILSLMIITIGSFFVARTKMNQK